MSNPAREVHELAGWLDVPRLSWVTSYAFSPSHLGPTVQKSAAACAFVCALVTVAISHLDGSIYTNRDRTACLSVRSGGLLRLTTRIGPPTVVFTVAACFLVLVFPGAWMAVLAVLIVFFASVVSILVSHALMAWHERSRGVQAAPPAAKTSHSKRCPDRRPVLTITSLAAVKYMTGVRLSRSLLKDPKFAGSCIRTTARTAGLARGYSSFGFAGASPKNPKALYKH